ncbi:MAG: CRISPR-associated protein Cas4 [Nitrososphaerota archaeon]|nr:CRISPR-associated protein Cas4 [Nitrososphaerales archaeon]MDW8045411.1 CRISPR-associated protein Cas4 [Nitrososphaerota archaeon]
MSEDDDIHLIPVTWIKQYHFCPRIIYYLGVLGYKERVTESMAEGRDLHIDEERRAKRRKTLAGERKELTRGFWSRVHIVSERLGLYGSIDEVVEVDDGLVVVENKFMKSSKKPHSAHIYQAIAYAMLVEEFFHKPVRKAVIRYVRDGRSFELRVTDDLKKHVLWTASKIRSIIEKEKLPRIMNRRRCRSCGFQRVCKDV